MFAWLFRVSPFIFLVWLGGWSHAESMSSLSQEDLLAERAGIDYLDDLPKGAQIAVVQMSHRIPDPLAVAEFWMDPRTGQFLANVIPSHGGVSRVSGVMRVMVDLPVPVRRLMPGDVLGPSDLEIARVPLGAVGSYAVADPSELVGLEVRRMLERGRPIMGHSLTKPFAVARGARVTIAFRQGPMRLMAPGRVLNDAHWGDDVRVVNLSSNKTITAVARGDGIVEVLN